MKMQKIYIYWKGRPERVGLWEIWSGFLCISHVPDVNLVTKDNGEQGRQVFPIIELTAEVLIGKCAIVIFNDTH